MHYIAPTHKVIRLGVVALTGSYVVCAQEARVNGGSVQKIDGDD